MKYLLLFIIPAFFPFATSAQETDSAYTAAIATHRAHYKQEFLTETRSPLTAKDTAYLDFFPANPGWNITATFTRTENAEPFDMPTYSGLTKRFVTYGTISFGINGAIQTLSIYRNLKPSSDPAYKDHLFLPFKDATNPKITYGGGRYIDLQTGDIQDGKVTIDFNKCYNPWCAYSDGFNCPVPPRENHLKIGVEAGERLFLGEKKH
jgi:uncharacterized protein (DUF1684 family)